MHSWNHMEKSWIQKMYIYICGILLCILLLCPCTWIWHASQLPQNVSKSLGISVSVYDDSMTKSPYVIIDNGNTPIYMALVNGVGIRYTVVLKNRAQTIKTYIVSFLGEEYNLTIKGNESLIFYTTSSLAGRKLSIFPSKDMKSNADNPLIHNQQTIGW